MSPKRTARLGTPEKLREELADAASRRLPGMFKDRGADEVAYPSLARLGATIEPRLWNTDPTRALLVVMRRAIDQLPDEKADQQYSEWSTWREIARLLYFGSEVDPNLHTYGEYRQRMKELTGYHWNASEKDLGNFTNKVRIRLADILLQMEREAIERRERVAVTQAEADQPQGKLIDRPEYLDRLQALVNAGHKVICIWGEPGTGKSTLAEQFSRRLACDAPVPIIRCAPMLSAMTPEAEIFRQDIASALAVEGVDSTKLSPESWFSRLCEQLAGESRSGAIVLDNVETNRWIEEVVRTRPKILVIMTRREQPPDNLTAFQALELGNFTDSQALEFIKRQLPRQDDEAAADLAHILGCRPLALEHAVRFVRRARSYGLRALTRDLAANVTEALSEVTPGDEKERNLKRLYKLILASLEEQPNALAVLDTFLAVVGGTGVGLQEVLYLFMRSDVGGAHSHLDFLTGLQELGRRGLVREQQGVLRRQLDEGGHVERTTEELAMHSLTYSILRALRGAGPLVIESRYWDFVLQGGHEALLQDETNAYEHAWLELARWAMRVANGGLPRGWVSLFSIDERTWMALMETDGDGESASTYVVRYAIRPNGVDKLDYRSDSWSVVEGQEATLLFLLITIYYERIHYQLQPLKRSLMEDEEKPDPDGGPQPKEPRLDNDGTPADGYRHVVIDPLALEPCRDREWSVWALCGKRFVPSAAADAGACPECESLQHNGKRLRDIEDALRRRFFTGLDYKDPIAAVRLFLVRARLRRDLERFEEAASDLDSASRFLLAAADAPDADVLGLGLALIREVTLLPEAHRQLVRRAYDYLLWRCTRNAAAQRPEQVQLRFKLAQLLGQWGQTAEALAEYQSITDGIDAGQLDASSITLSKVFLEKEEAERKLGHTSEANATLRRVIVEAEREGGEGKLLIACLMLAGAYLAGEDSWQAREDLQRAHRIAGAQQPPDYEKMWDCLIKLSNVGKALGSKVDQLNALEEALQLARDHLPHRVQQTEEMIARVRQKG